MTAEAPTTAKKASPWSAVARGAFGIAILAVVFTRVPLRDLAARFANVRAVDVVFLIVFGCLMMSTGVGRWRRLLGRLGERPSVSAVVRDLLVGALYNTFLPTSFGGDVIRAVRMSRRLDNGYHAWSSSLFERLVGMLTMALVGALGVALAIGDVLPARLRYIVVGMTVVFGVGFFFVSAPLRILVGILEKRLPSSFIANVRGVVTDLEGPLATAGSRLETFAWSAAGYTFNIGYIIVCLHAFGAPEHAVAVIVGVPIVSVLALAPVSLGGHGLREGLGVVVRGLLGVPKDVALGLALMALAYNVFFATLGGVVQLLEPTTPREAPAE